MELELTDSPSKNDKEAIERGLSAHAAENDHPWDDKEIGLFYRNEGGDIVAGLIGETVWGWLCIKHIWVSSELRGQGIGKSLVEAAEEEAKKRDCGYSSLDTFTFQTPEFYVRLGYQSCGQIEDFPKGENRIFYFKKL